MLYPDVYIVPHAQAFCVNMVPYCPFGVTIYSQRHVSVSDCTVLLNVTKINVLTN